MPKKIFIITAIIFIALSLLFISTRYGWKLFGFNACTSPDSIYIQKIEVSGNRVVLSGDTSASAPAFVGYIHKMSGGNLYIGLKYNLVFGFVNRVGHFDINIKCDTSQINKVYLRDGSSEKLVWEKGK